MCVPEVEGAAGSIGEEGEVGGGQRRRGRGSKVPPPPQPDPPTASWWVVHPQARVKRRNQKTTNPAHFYFVTAWQTATPAQKINKHRISESGTKMKDAASQKRSPQVKPHFFLVYILASLDFSSPRAGLCAESARAVTGRRTVPSQWGGRRLFGASAGSPHENGRNSGTKSRRLDPLVSKFA